MNPIDALFLIAFVPVAALWILAMRKGRRWSGAWLLTLAPLYLPMAEDGFLAIWYALVSPDVDPHGIAGVVEPHAAGHVLGAGVYTVLLSVMCAWIARRPLVRSEPWAWKALLGVGSVVLAVSVVELVFFYGHGLTLLRPAAAEEFGWPFLAAGMLAWAAGLWLARPGASSGTEREPAPPAEVALG